MANELMNTFDSGTDLVTRANFNARIVQGNNNFVTKADKNTNTILQTVSYTLALTDVATIQKCLSASTITVTIPLNSVVAFPINTEIVLARYGAGAVSVAATGGVTIYSSDSKKSINKQYEAVTLKKISVDEWLLIGSLSV